MHDYITIFLISLDIKELDINMVGYFIGNTGVHNINIRIIVFINWISIFLGKPNLPKHLTQDNSSLGRSSSINNLYFCGTQNFDQFCFRPVNNSTSLKFRIKSSSEYPIGRLISVCSVHKTHQF